MNALNEIRLSANLSGFEHVKEIFLTTSEFTVEEGLITPTFKLKRNELLKKFRPQIDGMYKANATRMSQKK